MYEILLKKHLDATKTDNTRTIQLVSIVRNKLKKQWHIRTTLDVYGQVTGQMKKDNIDRMDAYIKLYSLIFICPIQFIENLMAF